MLIYLKTYKNIQSDEQLILVLKNCSIVDIVVEKRRMVILLKAMKSEISNVHLKNDLKVLIMISSLSISPFQVITFQ